MTDYRLTPVAPAMCPHKDSTTFPDSPPRPCMDPTAVPLKISAHRHFNVGPASWTLAQHWSDVAAFFQMPFRRPSGCASEGRTLRSWCKYTRIPCQSKCTIDKAYLTQGTNEKYDSWTRRCRQGLDSIFLLTSHCEERTPFVTVTNVYILI